MSNRMKKAKEKLRRRRAMGHYAKRIAAKVRQRDARAARDAAKAEE